MRNQLVTVISRINVLLERIERGDVLDQERVEHTLTDGYAIALALDGECNRLERQLSDYAATLGVGSTPKDARELSTLARRLARRRRDLHELRDLLAQLKSNVRITKVA